MITYTKEQDAEANNFAMKLLMPEQKFIEVFYKHKGDFQKISNVFGTSYSACEMRALNLGLVQCV
jgi:Zn-dependent peptidase ImmA (M78 family)